MTSPLIDYLDELIDKIPLLDNVRREGAQQLRNALVNAAAAPDRDHDALPAPGR